MLRSTAKEVRKNIDSRTAVRKGTIRWQSKIDRDLKAQDPRDVKSPFSPKIPKIRPIL